VIARQILHSLKEEFPEKAIFPIPENDPKEILCEINPSDLHPDYSVAIAYINKSEPHQHIKSVETYEVEEGELDLYLDGVKKVLKKGQAYTINPGVIHWGEGEWVRIRVTSNPGWTLEDQIEVKKATSAGGVIVRDGKILVVKFPNAKRVTFPKGHKEEGETDEEAALREVQEETGLKNLRVMMKLGVVTRPATEKDGRIVIKDIHLFRMEITGEDKGKAEEETVWLLIDEAMTRLFPQEAEFLKKVLSPKNPAGKFL